MHDAVSEANMSGLSYRGVSNKCWACDRHRIIVITRPFGDVVYLSELEAQTHKQHTVKWIGIELFKVPAVTKKKRINEHESFVCS